MLRQILLASNRYPPEGGKKPGKTELLHGRFSWEKNTFCKVVIIGERGKGERDEGGGKREERREGGKAPSSCKEKESQTATPRGGRNLLDDDPKSAPKDRQTDSRAIPGPRTRSVIRESTISHPTRTHTTVLA